MRLLPLRGAAMFALLALSACDDSPSLTHYVLALSWEPAFCEFNADKQECAELDSADFAASNLTVHGLWPNDRPDGGPSYCDVDAATKALDEPESWCELPEPKVSEKTRAALAPAMPGVESCLDRHEWIKHGTCAKLDADAYFKNAVRLAAEIQATPLGQVIERNIGRYATPQQLANGFEVAYGAGASKALTLVCTSRGSQYVLTEVRIALEPSALEHRLGRGDLHIDGDPPAGSCPDDMRIDRAGP